MKRSCNYLIATVTVIVLLLTAFLPYQGIEKREASAQVLDDFLDNTVHKIYYFSDSEPLFQSSLPNTEDVEVVLDVHLLLTEQELAFMLYSGYFWGFDQTEDNIVIIELKTMNPPEPLLEELFHCLKLQGCKVLFISPYVPDYSSFAFADATMACPMDDYYLFLKNVVRSMLDDYGTLYQRSVFVIDGRFIGIDEDGDMVGTYDVMELLATSVTFRRLLMNMYYSCDSELEKEGLVNENNETVLIGRDELYEQIWDCYASAYLAPLGYDLSYFDGDTDIYEYINVWEYIRDNQDEIGDFEDEEAEFISGSEDIYEEYYQVVIDRFSEDFEDIHILAHINGTIYVDVTQTTTNYTTNITYLFGSWQALLQDFPPNDFHICFMGRWELKNGFYNFIDDMQDDFTVANLFAAYPNVNVYPFIWEYDPLIFDEDGITVILADGMQDLYGDGCGNCGECAEYDLSALVDIFLSILQSLLS